MKPVQPAPPQHSVFRAGGVQLDESRMELRVDGQRRQIEAKPLALLLALLMRAGAVASKRELMQAVWGNAEFISEGSLTTAVSKLRAALGDAGRDLIEVVVGSGYRIAAPVEVTQAAPEPRLAFTFQAGEAVPGRPQWRLEKQLGRAALNDVWLACHTKTGELRVFKFADSEARLETLKRETALSRVLHARLGPREDLIRILEWNFDTKPYFIESAYGGPDLPAWAETQGGLRAVSAPIRIAMLAAVARTLATAHAAGVLHSDIKPANILVDDRSGLPPRIRLVDFGAGGLNDAVRLEALAISLGGLDAEDGERGSGTLRYMPPEVLAGGVPTTGADIFALGILLYQLLAGDLGKSLVVGWEEDIADPLLREDIAAAAAGDPARRLHSAAALADRLETLPARHAALRAEAEAAARAAALARQVERARLRRPWMLAAAASMAAGLAMSTLFGLRAVQDRDEATRRAMIAQAVNSFLTEDLFGRGNPAQSGKADETLMAAAEAAEAGIGRRLAGEPFVAGSIYESLARAFDSRSAYDSARVAYGHAIAAFAAAGEPGRAELVIARLHQASMEVRSGEPGALARAQGIIEATAPLVPTLGKRAPEAAVWLNDGTAMLQMLGGDVLAAQSRFRQAADAADAMPELFDQNTRLLLRQHFAFTYLRLGQFAAAEAAIGDLLQRRLALNGPRHAASLQLQMNLAQARIAQGHAAQAVPDLQAIYPLFVSVFGADHILTLQLLGTRGQAYFQLQRYDQAFADQELVYRLALAKQGPRSFMALGALADASQSRCRSSQAQAGLQLARSAYDGASAAFGADSAIARLTRVDVAFCLIANQQARQAGALLDGLNRQGLATYTMDPDYDSEIDLMRAAAAFGAGDSAAGASLLRRVAPVFERPGADSFLRGWARALPAPPTGIRATARN